MTSVHEELEQLTAYCQELHRQHQDALHATEVLHQTLEQGEAIRVHYQCEDRDFGDMLEELHRGQLEAIEKGGAVRFGAVLLEALSFTTFPTDLKN